jgi:hypothetical protein
VFSVPPWLILFSSTFPADDGILLKEPT